jgi:endonuclease V-like protein UPF0215 family
MHIAKKGLRVLGIAESFSSDNRSILAGVVMRKDLRIDGFSFETTTIGGMDATDSVVSLYRNFNRQDINVVMISGCVISWFNIIDPLRVLEETGRPTIIVTYEDSEGIAEDIMHYFPHDEVRLTRYRALGTRIPYSLPTGHTIYLRPYRMSEEDAGALCSAFTYDGKIPEPLRVARLCARAIMHHQSCLNEETSSKNGI